MRHWIKIADTILEHPKVAQLAPPAVVLHLGALTYCGRNLTDGYVPKAVVPALAPQVTRGLDTATRQLLKAGLWQLEDGGFRVHDYLEWQQSAADVKATSDRLRQAGAKGGRAPRRRPEGEADA